MENNEHMMRPDMPSQEEIAKAQQGAQDEFAAKEKQIKSDNPKGEEYPYGKYINEPSMLEDIVGSSQEGKKLSEEQIDKKLQDAKNIALSSDEEYKEVAKADELLENETENAKLQLAQKKLQDAQKWIQQNPVAAAAYGAHEIMDMVDGNHSPMLKRVERSIKAMDASTTDEYSSTADSDIAPLAFKIKAIMDEEMAKVNKDQKSPLKYQSPLKQVRHMDPLRAFQYGRMVYQNPMQDVWLNLGNTVEEAFKGFEEEREKRRQERREEFEREAKDFDDKFGGNIQQIQMSQAFDDAGKELMAREWKTEFAQLNKLKAAGQIAPEEYAIRTRQLMGNAETYSNAVKQIENTTKTWVEDLSQGKISKGMKTADRDLINTLATGKGFNVVSMPDGRTYKSEGMTVRNVNGQPSLVGYTSGQMAQLEKFFQEKSQAGEIPADEFDNPLTFDQWLSKIPQADNAEAWGALSNQFPDRPELGKAMQGTMIPLANIQNGTGLPKILPNVGQDLKNAEQDFAKILQNDIVLKGPEYVNLRPDQKWEHRGAHLAEQWADSVLDNSDPYMMQSIAADYLDDELAPNEWERITAGKTEDEIRDILKAQLIEKVKESVLPPLDQGETYAHHAEEVVQEAIARGEDIAAIKGAGRQTTSLGGTKPPNASMLKQQESAALKQQVLDDIQELRDLKTNPGEGVEFDPALYVEKFRGRGPIQDIEFEDAWREGNPGTFTIYTKNGEVDIPEDQIDKYLQNIFQTTGKLE